MWRNESTAEHTEHVRLTDGREDRMVRGRAGRFHVYRAGGRWWCTRPEWVFPTVTQAKAFAEAL